MPSKVFFKIVIPNYNNFKYIKKCLDSISGQTFRDFFVVVVDDLSTDESFRIAKIFEKRDPEHFAAFRSPKKKYAGGCRNLGMDYPVDCEYMCFVDSDDYYASNDSLQKLYDAVKNDKPDVLLFDWARDTNGKFTLINVRQDINEVISRGKLAMSYWNASWSRIHRKTFAERFLEDGCMFGEDTWQFLKTMDRFPKVKQIHEQIYVYRNNPSGAVNTRGGIHEKTKGIFIKSLEKMLETAKNPAVRNSILKRLQRDGYRQGAFLLDGNQIPKTLHFVWFGKDEPPYVRFAIDSFGKVNPDFEINFVRVENPKESDNLDIVECMKELEDETSKYYRIFHSPHFEKCEGRNETMFNVPFSDAFRIFLLDTYGGIYLDCDTFPTKRFDDRILDMDYFQSQSKWSKNAVLPDVYFIGVKPGHEANTHYVLRDKSRKSEMPYLMSLDDGTRITSEWKTLNSKFRQCKIIFGESYRNDKDTYINHFCLKGNEGWWHTVQRLKKKLFEAGNH